VAAEPSRRYKAQVAMGILAGMAFVGSVWFYSFDAFPRIPQGLGGGRPVRLVILIDKPAAPADLGHRLPRVTLAVDSFSVMLKDAYLLAFDSKQMIVVDSIEPPASGIAFAREKIKAASW
jgi:hypothetical protein